MSPPPGAPRADRGATGPPRGGCPPYAGSTWWSTRARWSASPVSPGAASPRWPARCCGCSPRTPWSRVRCWSPAATCRPCAWGDLRALRWAEAVDRLPGGTPLAQPRASDRDPDRRADPTARARAARRRRSARVGELLEQVGLPRRAVAGYPHQLSGGQRQRVMIAMALACDPQLIVADEPTTALDVMVQAQILDLLSGLVKDLGVGLMIISHDLSVLADVCDRVAVMYAGRIVECGSADQVFLAPAHPYAKALSRRVPTGGRRGGPVRAGRAGRGPAGPAGASARLLVRAALPAGRSTPDRARSRRCSQVGGRQAACIRVGEPRHEPTTTAAGGARGGGRVHHPRRHRRDALDGVDVRAGGRDPGPGRGVGVRARPRWPGRWSACSGPPRARCGSRGSRWYSGRALHRFRSEVQMVLQDAAGSLNPRQTVYESVAEGIRLHGRVGLRRRGAQRGGAGRRGARRGRAPAAGAALPALPARAVRRAEAAGADRRRAGAAAAAADRRRAGLVASTPRSAARSWRCCWGCARSSGSASSWSPTTSAWPGTSPTGSR